MKTDEKKQNMQNVAEKNLQLQSSEISTIVHNLIVSKVMN